MYELSVVVKWYAAEVLYAHAEAGLYLEKCCGIVGDDLTAESHGE